MPLYILNRGENMNQFSLTSWVLGALIIVLFTGCEKGGCYYTCCTSEDECIVKCIENENSADECTVYAQQQCTQEIGGNLRRVEWGLINDLYCQTCGASACAPEWWTVDKLIYDLETEIDTDTDTDTTTSTQELKNTGEDTTLFDSAFEQ